MYALHSVPPHSAVARSQEQLVAIVYANEAYPQSAFVQIVDNCRRRGLLLSGVLQHPACTGAGGHCDVALENLATGQRTDLFEDRGPGARGCRLNVAALIEINEQISRSLDDDPALLILNKFGKVEAEGGGLLDLVAIAVDRKIPVLIGVPLRNLEAWRRFAGGMSVELSSDPVDAKDWLNAMFPVEAAQGSQRMRRSKMNAHALDDVSGG